MRSGAFSEKEIYPWFELALLVGLNSVKNQHTLHSFRNQSHMIGMFHIIMRLLTRYSHLQFRQDPRCHNSDIIRCQKLTYAFTSACPPQDHSALHVRRSVPATGLQPPRWVKFVWIWKYLWVPLRYESRNANIDLESICKDCGMELNCENLHSQVRRPRRWWRQPQA
jgi:hypothetical protein